MAKSFDSVLCTSLKASPERKRHKSLEAKPAGRISNGNREKSGLAFSVPRANMRAAYSSAPNRALKDRGSA